MTDIFQAVLLPRKGETDQYPDSDLGLTNSSEIDQFISTNISTGHHTKCILYIY